MAFVFPKDVDGWLTEAEGAALDRLAEGKAVLEIGSYKGKSTICLAQSAKEVVCVDPFDGRCTSKPEETWDQWFENLEAFNLTEKTFGVTGTSGDVLPRWVTGSKAMRFDLIFIDGDHSFDAVWLDITLSVPLLNPGGWLVFHDYRTRPGDVDGRWDPGVTQAVNELLQAGGELLERVGTLAVVRPPAVVLARKKPVVAMAAPRGVPGWRNGAAAKAFYRASSTGIMRLEIDYMITSLALRSFNRCWCEALGARADYPVTHFVMQHDDVCPDEGYLEPLLAELEAAGADMLSCVVPIKNGAGLTSTAVSMKDEWTLRRLSMKEIFELPETFTIEDIPWREKDSVLLANTGLWICKFDAAWVEKVCFADKTMIDRTKDGKWMARDISEDWHFARQLHELGLKVAVTRKIGLYHERPEFTNREVWGAWECDQAYFEHHGERAVP